MFTFKVSTISIVLNPRALVSYYGVTGFARILKNLERPGILLWQKATGPGKF